MDLDIATEYAAEDADITLRLFKYFSDQLAKEKSLNTLLETIEKPVSQWFLAKYLMIFPWLIGLKNI